MRRAFWAQIDVDVIKGGSPMWSFPANLRLQGNSAPYSGAACGAVEAQRPHRTSARPLRRASRKSRASEESRLQKSAELAANPGKAGRDQFAIICCRELGKRIDPEDMIFGEATRNTPAVLQQIPRPLQGTLMRVGGGGSAHPAEWR